jgi:chaperonin GroES
MSKKKMQPIHDLVLIKPVDPQTKTSSGLIIPDSAIEKQSKGTVIAHGDGIKGEPITVKKGDMVLYKKGAGMEVEYEGLSHLLMRETDIMAII